jgi:hypothetical protein
MIDTFMPFFGCVENIDDPDKLDRIQVRCYGYHTDNKAFIPTDMLLWVSYNGGGSGVSGIGLSGHGIVQGSTVFGFFLDKDLQIGYVLGTLKGKPSTKLMASMGFSDPDGVYPLYVNESDVNRIARNESIEKTIVGWKKNNRVTGIPGISGSWSEPETQYNTQYPKNYVFETESGHVIEYDDTPGAERISINHRTGTFDEYHPDGSKVSKVLGDSFQIFLGGSFIFINGDVNQVIKGNLNQNIMGNYTCKASQVTFDADVKILGRSEATDHISSGISGKSHRHTQNPDAGGHAQQPVNPPTGANGGFQKSGVSSYSVQFNPFDPNVRLQ